MVLLGPTASGKTSFACQLAYELNGEIISADSRQVYKGLDIGTGKDLNAYNVNGTVIRHHLIDIAEPAQQFYLHEYASAFDEAFDDIKGRDKLPVVCGGSGLYLEVLYKDFALTQVPEDELLRKKLIALNKETLISLLKDFPDQFENTDKNSVKRIIRGIEIGSYLQTQQLQKTRDTSRYKPLFVGIHPCAEERKKRIDQRLDARLQAGMLEEARGLLQAGVTHERLERFGLEYKFLSYFLKGTISYDELREQLGRAIFQFSRRQMTWFRRMEKEGVKIRWFDPEQDAEEILAGLRNIFH